MNCQRYKTTIAVATLASLCLPAQGSSASDKNRQVPVSEPLPKGALESVCHLWIKRRVAVLLKQKFTGSAVLYRGRYLLTAGHNVYQDRSRLRNVEVRCGTADAATSAVHETIEPWQAIDASGYTGRPFSRDFGVIRLNRPISVSKPFHLAAEPTRVGEAIRFAGYPGGPYTGWKMFATQGAVVSSADGLAYYDVETFKSNSGGPVWREGADPELIAIHVTEGGGRVVDAIFRREVERLIAELDRRAADNSQ